MKYRTLDEGVTAGGKVEVLAYPDLKGAGDAATAERLHFLKTEHVVAKTVRITLNHGRARLEPGALYHMQGNLEFDVGTNGGIGKALFRRAFTGETFFVNEIAGSGEILLEPTWGHFIIMEITRDVDLIVEKGVFYASVGDIDVGTLTMRNLGAGALGGEGWFQNRISGEGLVVLNCPVPFDELQQFDMAKGKLKVDGTFAVMRTGDVVFKVEKSAKSWIGTAVTGEGLLQSFSGTGQVWIAPTKPIYEALALQGLNSAMGVARRDTSG
jgi:uncharacterized protein (AIM24 family)